MIVDASWTGDAAVGSGAESLLIDSAVEAAESVLARRFGSSITLVSPERLACSGPAITVRARVASASFALPRTLVIKHFPKAVPSGEPDPFAREAAGYQLFTALPLEDRMCPELLAHSAQSRVLVIDDPGRLSTLQDKLAGSDSRAAENALLSWARSLGKMHFSTAGREADFHALLRRLSSRSNGDGGAPHDDGLRADEGLRQDGDRDGAVDGVPPLRAIVELSALLHDDFGVPTPDAVRQAVQRAGERVRTGGYRAFSLVDLWPDNSLLTGEGVRFLDFERGRIRSALADAAHLRVPFASSPHPLALPAGMSESMISAWRAEVAELWPALADDDTLSAYLLDTQLMLVWLLSWQDLPGLNEAPGASPTGRAAALVTWWGDLARNAERSGERVLAEHAATVAEALDARFGPGLELAMYPAFR